MISNGLLRGCLLATVALAWTMAFAGCVQSPNPPMPSAPAAPRSATTDPNAEASAEWSARTSSSPAGDGVFDVPTTAPGESGSDALAEGVLGGTLLDGRVCFWLAQPDARTALVWPYGFRATGQPLTLLGPDGQRIAEPGDRVGLGGGAPGPDAPTRDVDPCSFGRVFVVSTVGTVDGRTLNLRGGSLRLETRALGELTNCPEDPLREVMLVMSGGRLRLRLPEGDVDATWPAGFSAVPGSRISIVSNSGLLVLVQGVPLNDLRAARSGAGLDVCGLAEATFN